MTFKKTLFLICLLSIFSANAQNKNLRVKGIEGLRVDYPKIIKDTIEAKIIGQEILANLYQLSYLGATIDKVLFECLNRQTI